MAYGCSLNSDGLLNKRKHCTADAYKGYDFKALYSLSRRSYSGMRYIVSCIPPQHRAIASV